MGALSILVIIAFPICGLIGYYIKTKNQERMKLIEQGVNPDEGLSISEYRKQTTLRNAVLISIGFVLIQRLDKELVIETGLTENHGLILLVLSIIFLLYKWIEELTAPSRV